MGQKQRLWDTLGAEAGRDDGEELGGPGSGSQEGGPPFIGFRRVQGYPERPKAKSPSK